MGTTHQKTQAGEGWMMCPSAFIIREITNLDRSKGSKVRVVVGDNILVIPSKVTNKIVKCRKMMIKIRIRK